MDTNTLERFAEILGEMLTPFASALESTEIDEVHEFIEDLGYTLSDGSTAFSDLQNASKHLTETIAALSEKRYELENGEGDEEALIAILVVLLAELINFFVRLHQLPDALRSSLPADYLATTNIDRDIVDRLYAYLFTLLLEDSYPAAVGVLKFIGVIEETDFEQDESIFQPEFTLYSIHWERLGQILSDPSQVFEDVYGWGTPEIDAEKFYNAIIELTTLISVPAEIRNTTIESLNALAPDVPADEDDLEPELWIALMEVDDLKLYLVIHALPNQSDTEPQAIALSLQVSIEIEEVLPLAETLFMEISSSVDLSSGISVILQPDQGLRITLNTFSEGGSELLTRGEAALKLAYKKPENEPIRVLTISDNAYLDLGEFYLEPGIVYLPQDDDFDFIIEAGLIGGHFIYKNEDNDGFINNILPQKAVESNFDLIVAWSKKKGIAFKGSGSLDIELPTHISLGPIDINTLYFIVGLETDTLKLPIEVSASISANLGPLQASVERIGVKLDFDIVGSGGELGPFDLELGFKPPNGVGLAIDAGVVKGGGYLYFDFEKEEYAGALELAFAEFLTLKAIGLITTRMPDGSKGFSLLVIITAEFGSPIQLGFGFTLSGVGGLLGLNRTMRLDPLVEGVRTGAVNSVMFPTNVIENAPRIISDLRRFFPPQQDIFLIGPMAKIGWGTPNLVTLSLGIIIEIPGNIAILGVLKVALPDEDAALLILQVNFLGAIEFDKKRAWFFASMFESRVLFMTIEGEMGILIAWGDNANFVVSVGGFHPAFNPPPLPFPEPKRIAISILNESWAKIRVEGYFAVTSNTVQFGARVELFFGVSAFNIDGHLAFDALFQFSPFYFIIQISASLSVKVFGIGLFSVRMRGALEGPTPWHVEGTGSISLLFFDIDVDFSHTWGEEADTTLPPIDVMPLLKAEYEKLENWKAEVPAANRLLVSLRKIETTEDLVLHPVGTLKISQRAVPLDLTIDKVGAQKPSDANYFTLSIDTDDPDIEEKDETQEMFAMAQFKDMDDSKKLSAPAYEKQNGGLEVSVKGEQLKTSSAVKRIVRYEQIIIDSNFKRFVKPFFTFFGILFTLFLKGSAVTKSPLSNTYQKQKMPFADKIAITPNLYVVASNTDNTPFKKEAMTFTSYAQAEEFMNQQVQDNPNLQDSLHVIPQVEMKRAA